MLEWLCLLGFVLGLITVVGHGIWALLAWIIRRMFDLDREPLDQSMWACLQCGARLSRTASSCPRCGWSSQPSQQPLADLKATARQLERFRQSGTIAHATYERVMKAIEAEEARLMAPERPALARPVAFHPTPPLAQPTPPAAVMPPAIPVELPPIPLAEAPSAGASADTAAAPPAGPIVPPRHKPLQVLGRPQPLEPPPPPAPPRKPFAEVLAAFMEEKNIRWGELVGGLLIVGCSIALVLSFWAEIAARPYLRFGVFTGVTAALFGVGIYSDHRWKLPTTSRGLLVIATLLVPLNFLAISAFSAAPSVGADFGAVGGELFALALFAGLVFLAGRVIVPQWPTPLTIGVLGSSAVPLLVRRFAATPPVSLGVLLVLGSLPLLFYLSSTGWMLLRTRAWSGVDARGAAAVFTLLGTVTFAALVPFGFLIWKTGDVAWALRQLAPLASLGGVPALACGLMLWRRLTDPELAALRTAGTSVGVVGAATLVAGIVLAWPSPASMLPVALIDFVALTAVAIVFRIPPAHLFAAPCLVLAYLIGFHVAAGHVGWQADSAAATAQWLLSASSGRALVAAFAGLALAAGTLQRLARQRDSQFYLAVSGAVGLISVALVSWHGFGRLGDPEDATWVYSVYAVAAFAGAVLARREEATWAGSVLLLGALVQAIVFRFAERVEWQAWQFALMAHASASIVAAAVARRLGAKIGGLFAGPLAWSALGTALAAVPFWLLAARTGTIATMAASACWVAVLWAALAWLHGRAALFTAAQAALSVAVALAATALVETRDWFVRSQHPWLDPWTLEIQGIALAALSLAWVGLRLTLRKFGVVRLNQSVARDAAGVSNADWRETAALLVYPRWPSFDRIVTVAVLAGLIVLSAYAVLPGVAQELAPRGEPPRDWPALRTAADHASGLGSWILLATIVLVLKAGLWERFERWHVCGVWVTLAAGCPLLAAQWPDATASALRWCAAAFLAVGSLPIWFRTRVAAWAARVRWPEMADRWAGLATESRWLLLLLAITPVLALTLYPASAAIAGQPPVGAAAASFFGRVGNSLSFAVPLAVVCMSLVGHAVRERSSAFALSAGLMLNLTVTLGYTLSIVESGGSFGAVEWARLVQFNAIASAVFALAWLGSRGWLARRVLGGEPGPVDALLKLQVALAVAGNVLLIVPADVWLFLRPVTPGSGVAEAGGVFGWLALVLAGAAVAILAITCGDRVRWSAVGAALLAVGSLISFDFCGWENSQNFSGGQWWGYHALVSSRAAVAWLILGLGWLARNRLSRESASEPTPVGADDASQPPARGWLSRWLRESELQAGVVGSAAAAGVIAVVLALRAAVDLRDPQQPWWAAGAILATGLLMAGLARWSLRGGFLFAAAILVNLATTIWWLHEQWQPSVDGFVESLVHLADANVIALALPAVAWLMLELQVLSPARVEPQRRRLPAVHHFAAIVSLVVVAVLVAQGLAADAAGRPLHTNAWLDWTAAAAAAVLLVACCWDRAAVYSGPGLYVLGLVAIGLVLDRFDLRPQWLGWTGLVIAAAYSVATSYLWSIRERWLAWSDRLGVPRRTASSEPGWLVPANLLLMSGIVLLAFWSVLTFDSQSLGLPAAGAMSIRVLAAKAALVQVVAVALLARGSRRSQLQQVALALGVVGAVAWGWAWLEPDTSGNLLNRAVVLLTVLAAATALYGVGLGKLFARDTEWTAAARSLLPGLVGLAGASLIFVLTTEVVEWARAGIVSMGPAAIAAVIAALAGLCVAGLVCAVVPGRDPLELSERGRMSYVYAAEVLGALLFMHVRLTMPWLFHGWFMRYWTLIVVAIAFLGVGLSEIFRRQKRLVLAEPLERTGALLPLLPVVSLWILPSQVPYNSLLLVAIGVLYGVLSIARKSFGFGVLAAIAANGGLWYYLHHVEGYGLFQHPQLWLVPFSLCVLAAAYLNREQLSEQQMTTIRYVTVMIVYVSSTAEIPLNGVREAPWLPLVLGGLAVAGIFAGIMLRVRAFLYLGSSFLVIALLTMILSAHLNLGWTWLWWVAGITLGVLIIALFAVFEKKRSDVLLAVEGLKQWKR